MFLPDSNIPFASRFPVKCFFTPLSKSLQLDTVKLLVMERHVLRVDATAAESALHNISTIATSRTSTIFQSEHTSFDQTSGLLATEGDEPPAEWSLSLPVQLPESFDLASQSVLAGIINISHRVVVKAQFRDTENNANITVCDSRAGKNEVKANCALDRGRDPFLNLYDPSCHRKQRGNPRPLYRTFQIIRMRTTSLRPAQVRRHSTGMGRISTAIQCFKSAASL